MIERNVVLQLKREGYSNREILAISQNEVIGLDKNKVKKELKNASSYDIAERINLSDYSFG
jgi:hypothetical protein